MGATLSVPLSALELRDAVRQSRTFNASRLDRVLRLDAARALVEVQAGTTWQSLAAHLRPGDAALARTRTTLPTVGASVAQNAAGPDGRPVVAHVESLTLITPDGELRRASRTDNAELFALAVGGQGLFGTLYSITLRIDSLARAASEAADVERLVLPASGGPTTVLQVLVPPERLGHFLEEARGRCSDWRLELQGVEVREIHQEGETYLRWARSRYAELTLRLPEPATLGGSVRARQLRRVIIDAAISQAGSFPIACTTDATRAQVERCYPQLKGFLAEKRRIDPGEKLINGWYLHHRNLLGRQECAVRWSR